MNQRWLEKRDTYRAPGDLFRPSDHEVAEILDDNTPRGFIKQHHYSHSYPPARIRVGLYRHGTLVGVAVFSQQFQRTITNVFPGLGKKEGIELGRFVLLDEVGYNGETWFLGQCFRILRDHEVRAVVSFSDPMPRKSAAGITIFPGHIGTIYQAHNARYTGRGTKRTLRLLPDCTVLSDRTIQKVRAGERGWQGAVRLLNKYGAELIGAETTRAERFAWVHRWVPAITRPLRHPGNYRYVWALDRRLLLPDGFPYPKQRAA